jgi:hypothetical protein
MILQICIIGSDQTGGVQHYSVAGKRFQFFQKTLLIKIQWIDLSEIGLYHSPGIMIPPVCHALLLINKYAVLRYFI